MKRQSQPWSCIELFSLNTDYSLILEAKAADVGTLEVHRAVQICQQKQGEDHLVCIFGLFL